MFDSILVVCTGNICRSPMEEALLRHELGATDNRAAAAGIAALAGQLADPLAQEVMKNHGHNVSDHRGRLLNAALLSVADPVLVLDGTCSPDRNRIV